MLDGTFGESFILYKDILIYERDRIQCEQGEEPREKEREDLKQAPG